MEIYNAAVNTRNNEAYSDAQAISSKYPKALRLQELIRIKEYLSRGYAIPCLILLRYLLEGDP